LANFDERLLNVDSNGVLKIPLEMWLAIAFLCRHWLLALAVTVSYRRNHDAALLLGSDFTWVVLALEVPTVCFFLLCILRSTNSGHFVRYLWQHAVWLPLGTIILHLGYVIWYLSASSYWLPWPELFLVSSALIDLAIGVAFIRSEYWQKVLSEFPIFTPKGQKK
jgi:hypothetical protein